MAKSKAKPKKPDPAKGIEQAVEQLVQAGAKDPPTEQQVGEKVRLVEDDTGHRVLIYAAEKGINVELRYEGDTFWASQAQMAKMFGVNIPSISRHLKNIFDDGELDAGATVSKIERVGDEGGREVRRQIETYNLNAMISVGYRVESKLGTLFRIWATERLVQILTKGFYVDKERLKNQGAPDVLDEFREIAREIRTSIRNSYREVLRLCTLCADYDGGSQTAREFFMAMENKLLWASANKTAPQLVLERCDLEKPDLGLTYFAGKRGPTQRDVLIGNNYLAEGEARTKNRMTDMWLTYVEDQLDQGRLPTMASVGEKLDGFIKFNQWPLLTGKGRHKREDAEAHALAQLALYRSQQLG
jgi:hypothetical protein